MKHTEKKKQHIGKLTTKAVNVSEIAKMAARETGLPVYSCEILFSSFLDVIKNSLKEGRQVKIKNFGVFEVRKSKERLHFGNFSENPKVLPETKRVKFRSSNVLNSQID